MFKRMIMAGVLALLATPCLAASDQDMIADVLKATWDKPDAPLLIGPMAVQGDHAVSGWVQGDMGGRALMRRQGGRWIVWLCSGDALREASVLERTGVAAGEASRLAAALAVVEAGVPDEALAKFSRFEGEVFVAGDPNHGAGSHGTHKH